MNLALIDPFQLAQDSPDALTNDLSTWNSQGHQSQHSGIHYFVAFELTKNRIGPCDHLEIQSQRRLSRLW